MYLGRAAKQRQYEQRERRRYVIQNSRYQNICLANYIYERFQQNMAQFAREHKDQINSDPLFRDRFSEMCQQYDVNPMSAYKSIWSYLGFGDFYQYLAMVILDICAKHRHLNGGLMRINDIIDKYQNKMKNKIIPKDVVRAIGKAYVLGNLSIVDDTYVCTVPLYLNYSLSLLLGIATKFGFVSARLLKQQKNWNEEDFEQRIKYLRSKGIVWIDKNVPNGPHYYFLSHLGTNFSQFKYFMLQY